jgi:hypothetical protein
MTELSLKTKYRELVTSLKEHAKSKGSRMTNEDIASFLGYDRSYFSSLVGERGKVTEQHIKDFMLHFPTLGSPQGEQAQTAAPPPVTVKGEDVLSKYVRLLESNQKLEEKIAEVHANLIAMPDNLKALTHLILKGQEAHSEKLAAEISQKLDSIERRLISAAKPSAPGKKQVQKGKH